jgi:quercetin dioxygenase-like cupin family protein
MMEAVMRIRLLWAVAFLVASTPLTAAEQSASPPKANEFFRSAKSVIGQDVLFPTGNAEIVATTVDFAPGSETLIHKHPYPRSVYVLEGTITVTMEGGDMPPHDYPAGTFFVEGIDMWHKGTNLGTTPVRLLVIDAVAAGMNNSIPKPK